jgi:RNA polymerase sigma-70 factor (ECF subfamily)
MYLDSISFENMYTRWYPSIYHFVLFKIRDSEQSKDITSEVFLSALRSWKEVPEDELECRKRLFIIAKSRIIDYFRSAHHNRSVSGLSGSGEEDSFFDNQISSEPLPEEYFAESEGKKLATELLNLVSPEERDLLVLRFIEDLSYKELVDIYEISEQALRKRVERALKKIQATLDHTQYKKVENTI